MPANSAVYEFVFESQVCTAAHHQAPEPDCFTGSPRCSVRVMD